LVGYVIFLFGELKKGLGKVKFKTSKNWEGWFWKRIRKLGGIIGE